MRLIALVFLPCVLADAQFRLLHRVFHPLEQPGQYSQRGSILLSASGVVFNPSDSAPHDLLHFAETIQDLDGALYQVALDRDGDSEESRWDFSSVKLCHLLTHTSDHLVLHLTGTGKPSAIDYFVAPIPHGGTCPKRYKKNTRPEALKLPSFLNTTISLRSPEFPPQPTLRTPPPLTPEGAPVQPIPEKTLFQKYWMYILAIGMAILLSGGGSEEEVPRRGSA